MHRVSILVIVLLVAGAALPLMAQDSTDEPTTSAQSTPEATALPMPVATGHIRIAHLSADTPPIQIYLDGELSDIQTIAYPAVTGWIELPVGTYSVAAVPIDQPLENAALGPVQLSFNPNAWITIAALGSFEDGTLTAQLIPENYNRLPLNTARVSIVHAIPDAPAVDVIVDGDMIPVQNLGFSGAVTVEVPAGDHAIQVVATGTSSPALLELPDVTLNAGDYVFLAAVGTVDTPDLLVNTVSTDQVQTFQPDAVGTIVDVLEADGRFTTLLQALDAAGLRDTLSSDGAYTLFAPVDASFAGLDEDSLSGLLANVDQLREVLLYHVVDGVLMSQDVVGATSIPTLGGGNLTVTLDDRGAFLNNTAQVIIVDIPASNGVIHAINSVLMPDMAMATAESTPAS